jgi:DNA primase
MLSKFDIQKLQDLPIEQVAGALGLSVNHHKALCPFHDDKHPSLSFSVRKNRYRCFVCDAHGGVIDLVMRYLNKSFLEACKWLADENNLVVSSETILEPRTLNLEPKAFDASRYERYFERPFLSKEARHFLFEERLLDPRVVRWCRLTSWRDMQEVPWLQIPYYDREGKLIGIQNRNLVKGATPRFRFPQGAKCSIYNLQILNLLRPGETLFIAEGCSDAWSLMSAGHKAIAIPSATLLTRKDKELLQSLNSHPSTLNLHFAMFPDQDLPGERLFLQLREVLPSLVRHQLPRDCKDFSDLYLKSLNS